MNLADMERMLAHRQFRPPERETVPGSVPDGFGELGPSQERALAAFYQGVGMDADDSRLVAKRMLQSLGSGRVKLFAYGEDGEITGLAGFQQTASQRKDADLRIRDLHQEPLAALRATSGLIALAEREARRRGLDMLTAPDVPLGSRDQMFLSNRGYLPDDEFELPLPSRRTWRLLLDAQKDYVELLAAFQQPGRALDLGAGLGEQAIALRDASYAVTAVDKDSHSLAALNGANDALGGRFEVVEGNVATFEPSGEFDLVNMRHILHFLKPSEVPAAMTRMQECTVTGGIHCVTVWSDRNPPHHRRPHPFSEAELAEYYAGWQFLKHSHLQVSATGQWVIELVVRKQS